MLRRDVLSSLGLGGLMTTPLFGSLVKENSTDQFLIVIKLYIGQLAPTKAFEYSSKVKAELASSKPENFNFLLVPTRTEYTEISVYELGNEKWHGSPNEDKYEEWMQLLDDDKLKEIYRTFGQGAQPRHIYVGKNSYKEYVKDCAALHCGAPVVSLPVDFDEYFDYAWDMANKYKVMEIQEFVVEYMKDHFGPIDFDDDEHNPQRSRLYFKRTVINREPPSQNYPTLKEWS